MVYELQRKSRFSIFSPDEETLFWGCDQEWYQGLWQKKAGCGPTAVSTMLLYLLTGSFPDSAFPVSQESCISLMEQVWQFVTPTSRGIPSVSLLKKGVQSFCDHYRLPFRCGQLELSSQNPVSREEILAFLKHAFIMDLPVAFLNLDAGKEEALDSWHWVTLIGLSTVTSQNTTLTFLDEGEIKTASLELWLSTTRKGGGFFWFSFK